MKSVKSATRRAGLITAAACSALALASCSAGHITQTSDQVAAVDGSSADGTNGALAVRDVTVTVDDSGSAALKFTAINQDPKQADHRLESVSVNGKNIGLAAHNLKPECALVGAAAPQVEAMPTDKSAGCVEYVATSVDNDNFAIAGSVDVAFAFDTDTIEVPAAVSAAHMESGNFQRDFDKEQAH